MSVFSFRRVGAMMLRYVYVLRSSWLRALETAYWPAIQLLTWGFLQSYFASAGVAQSGPARIAGTLIGAVLLGTLQQVVTVTISSVANLLIVGLLLIGFVVLAPSGIIGLWGTIARRAKR